MTRTTDESTNLSLDSSVSEPPPSPIIKTFPLEGDFQERIFAKPVPNEAHLYSRHTSQCEVIIDPGGFDARGEDPGACHALFPADDVENGVEPNQEERRTRSKHDDLVAENKRLRLKERFERLKRQRNAALQVRLKAHEQRNALQQQRRLTTDLDANFMKSLNAWIVTLPPNEVQTMISQYEECRRARDTYQPLEDDYNSLENQLDQLDYELNMEEEKLYSDLQRSPDREEELPVIEEGEVYHRSWGLQRYPNPQNEFFALDELEKSPFPSTASINSDVDPSPPLVTQYLSRSGDADVIKERLSELRNYRAHLIEVENTREPLGIPLDPSSLDFLSNFDSRDDELQEELLKVQADVQRLRVLCEQQSLLDVEDASSEEDDLDDLGPIPKPDGILFSNKESSPDFSAMYAEKKGSTGSTHFINAWLLHRLRNSSVEVERLVTSGPLRDLGLDQQTLKRFVLDTWPEDGAVLLNAASYPNSTRSDFPLSGEYGVAKQSNDKHSTEATQNITSISAVAQGPGVPRTIDREPGPPMSFSHYSV